MSSVLQDLVDDLGKRLDRSVAIDDPDLRLCAYNSNPVEVDEQRMISIMQRKVPDDVVAHSYRLGCGEAHDVFTEPACPELGCRIERIGMPIRYDGVLLGFVWLMRSEGPLTDEVAAALRQTAGAAATVLHREQVRSELAHRQERELVSDLLFEQEPLRTNAATRAIEAGFVPPNPVTAIVVVLEPRDEPPGEKDDRAVAIGLDRTRRELSPRHAAAGLIGSEHGVLLVMQLRQPSRLDLGTVGAELRERVVAESGRMPEECWVGIGESRENLAEVHESYAEARRATEVASVSRALGAVAEHRDLGIYGVLADLPPARLRRGVPRGLVRLLEDGRGGGALVETLEMFLDNAGNVKRTAELLCLQRASLYYRLRRIEEIAEVDLNSGADRLRLHVGMKITRLIGSS